MNRVARTLGLALLTVFLAGCSGKQGDSRPAASIPEGIEASQTTPAEAKLPFGVSHATLSYGGLERTYRLFVPSKITDESKVALVVGLHGGLGTGDQFAGNSNFETLAEQEGFIVAFPDGTNRTWNGGNCCGQAAARKVDDVGFLAALIGELEARLPVDTSRVFMTGHSNGGIMAFRFGCERPELVRAIAPVAGSLEVPKCAPAHGVSLLAIHGDADQNHPINGGEGPQSIAGVPFVSMEKSLSLWTTGMGCETNPAHATAGAITSTAWTKCRDGATATFMVVADADHPWPGGTARPGLEGRVSNAIDATTAIWAFFSTVK